MASIAAKLQLILFVINLIAWVHLIPRVTFSSLEWNPEDIRATQLLSTCSKLHLEHTEGAGETMPLTFNHAHAQLHLPHCVCLLSDTIIQPACWCLVVAAPIISVLDDVMPTLTAHLEAKFFWWMSVSLPNSDVCTQGVTCPTALGETYTVRSTVYVSNIVPAVSVVLQ